MSQKYSIEQDSKWLYPNESLECLSLDGEMIFFSTTKREYCGVSGIAADVLKVLQRLHTGLRVIDLINEIAGGQLLEDDDRNLILEAVATLIDLGAIHER